ncbi:MAG: antitoxin VapB family protein [Thermofilum sp.]
MQLQRYATISVPVEVKRVLEKAKGNMEWGEFLLQLYQEARRLKRIIAFKELVEALNEEDLEEIARSSREFRDGFVLR